MAGDGAGAVVKLIPLTHGLHAMVDDEDYDELMKYKWEASRTHDPRFTYARRRVKGGSTVSMSAHLTGPEKTAHLDENGLNYQRENLWKTATRPLLEGGLKRCRRRQCRQEKPQHEFNRQTKSPDGLQDYCRPCQRIVRIENRERRPPRRRSELPPDELAAIRKKQRDEYAAGGHHTMRKWNLLKKFGITYEEKQAMFEAQDGRCGSCFGPIPLMGVEGRREPSVDHSYVTGKVRGLLDTGCNTAEGQLKRDFRNSFALGMYQLNDGPYYGPIAVSSDLGTWTSAVKRIDGVIGRVWTQVPNG